MRREDSRINRWIRDLVLEIGSSDERVVDLLGDDTDQAVSRFAAKLLSDGEISDGLAARVLWLLPMFVSSEFVAAALDRLKTNPAVAHAAVTALSCLKDESIGPRLISIVGDTSAATESRAAAARSLCHYSGTEIEGALARILTDSKTEQALVVAAAVSALGAMTTTSEESARVIATLLGSASPDVRIAALTALGNLESTWALQYIAPLLDDDASAADGRHLDEVAAQVVRRLTEGPELVRDGLRSSIAGDEDDWRRFRMFCGRLHREGKASVARRFESSQFMPASVLRLLCLTVL